MIIGVDAGSLSINDSRLHVGIYRVVTELLTELSIIDIINTYRLYGFSNDIFSLKEKISRVEYKILTPSFGWSQVRLPLELSINPVQVYLGLSQKISEPIITKGKQKNIGFIYDLGFIYSPHAYGNALTKLVKQTSDLVKHSNHIITISESTKNDIRKVFGLDETQISVCYPGVGKEFFPDGERYENRNPYFLFVGSLNKAKDIPALLVNFSNFLQKTKNTYDLVLAGGDYWPDSNIDKYINMLNLSQRIKKVGHVSDTELSKLYRGAVAYVTCALREGFCIPAAESMRCGTPVVAYDKGAMKEVVGKAGIVVAQDDSKSYVSALQTMSADGNKKQYSKNAYTQSHTYSWKKMAQQVYEIINRV